MQKLNHSQLAALVRKVQNGNMDAFATLYAATVDGQLYFATTFLKDAAMAEDVIQEVYLSLFQNIGKLENPKLFIAYLNRICYNTCVNHKRKLAKNMSELNEDALSLQHDEYIESNPDERYAMLERSNELQSALARLPDQLRATFLYRNYYDMRIAEIAVAMNCSDSTVKRNIRAATAKLKELLQSSDHKNNRTTGRGTGL